MSETDNWEKMLLNDLPLTFLWEVVIRTMIMFFVILIALRTSGKRGIKQLSIFELVLIIGLGSAAGDPMFYEDVGLLPAFTVFLVVVTLYMIVTKLSDKYKRIEKLLEGEPLYTIVDGQMLMASFKTSGLSQDEFFGELRIRNIEHLGQVKTVLIETSGEFSILYYPDDEVKAGLPIYPDALKNKVKEMVKGKNFSCTNCGFTFCAMDILDWPTCTSCESADWVEASAKRRIA